MNLSGISSEELRFRSVSLLGTGLVVGLFSTVRFEREGTRHFLEHRRAGQPVLFVFWHDQLLPLVHVHRHEGATVLVSEHADGEYIARILERRGFHTARGSSTRGGSRGLRELLRAAKGGRDVAITPDGPRGPRHRFKESAIGAARLLDLPIVPVAAAASAGWRLDSWDRFLIPRPFSRVQVLYGRPRTVPPDADRGERRRIAEGVERVLEELTERARRGVRSRRGGRPRRRRSREVRRRGGDGDGAGSPGAERTPAGDRGAPAP